MKSNKLLTALLTLAVIGTARAETLSANGVSEISVKANGDLINARRLAREQAEKNAVGGMLKLKLSADLNDPKVKNALEELRTQLSDNLKTSFNAEGDILTARAIVGSGVWADA
jgi:hypothetical protein